MIDLKDIEILTVNFQTADLIERQLRSRDDNGYEFINTIVVDNSTSKQHQDELDMVLSKYTNVKLYRTNRNFGHGGGVNVGWHFITKPYVLLLDSDTWFSGVTCLHSMVTKMNDQVFMVGLFNYVDQSGHDLYVDGPGHILYVHPSRVLINKNIYDQLPCKVINHGAPLIQVMSYVHQNNLRNLLVEEPNIDYMFPTSRRGTVDRWKGQIVY